MSEYISTIDDAFDITGRGCVITPGVPLDGKIHLRIGDSILLKLPDGGVLRTTVGGVEMICNPEVRSAPILVGEGVTKARIPPGTELWTALPTP